MSSPTWVSTEAYPAYPKITLWGWMRVAVRGGLILLVMGIAIVLLLVIRLIEKPIFGLRRPVGGFIPPWACRTSLRLMGLRYVIRGKPIKGAGAVVANHSSWLDIFTLNARNPVFFVAKSEVAAWPGIGFLSKLAGTVFIARDRKEAKAQQMMFQTCLKAGQKLLFFPEGTSTDAQRVLPFKTTLFQAFLDKDLQDDLLVQPVTVNYIAPKGQDKRFYGWWGDMDFGAHMLQMLATSRHGRVEVIYHAPIKAAEYSNRKVLAAHCEARVRAGHQATGDTRVTGDSSEKRA